jgi:hypothetical protein
MMCSDSKCDDDELMNKPTIKLRMEPTKKPPTRKWTKKPTMKLTMILTTKLTMKPRANREAHSSKCENYKEDRNYQKEVNSWCFRAHQLCCSSAKKFYRFRNFCNYYGFKDPGKQAKVAAKAGYDPLTLTTINCMVCSDSNCDANETNPHQSVEPNAKISMVIHRL